MNPKFIKIGNHCDSFEDLQPLVSRDAKDLCSTLVLAIGEKITIPFWTGGFSELIAVVDYEKKPNNEISYNIDYSHMTL
ncbi:MAG: hypothetical protein K2F82_00135 [Muribaculaceae bacterium]|nr:hypothetical protein [Muribaculaceae bacterium]MDE6462995.1 hypothetical protein [Muribaculaceae bacterium]